MRNRDFQSSRIGDLNGRREHTLLPAVNDHAAPQLSVVIPAFNEMARLPAFLGEVRDYLTHEFDGDYEVLVVDDGSSDETPAFLYDSADAWPQLVVICCPQNRGKGGAVRTGVLAAQGEFVLFADADGATPIAEEARLRAAIRAGADAAVGSRKAAPGGACVRTVGRGIMGRVFSWLACKVTRVGVRDPQCGFKMFRRSAGRVLFELCDEPGYLFDLQILGCAQQLGFGVAEVGVAWSEKPGSKVRLLRDSSRMLRGLWTMRRRIARLVANHRSCDKPARDAPQASAVGGSTSEVQVEPSKSGSRP